MHKPRLFLLLCAFIMTFTLFIPLAFPVSGQGGTRYTLTLTAISEILNNSENMSQLMTQYPVDLEDSYATLDALYTNANIPQRATIRPPFGGRSTSLPVSTPVPTRRPSLTPRPTRTEIAGNAISNETSTPSPSVTSNDNGGDSGTAAQTDDDASITNFTSSSLLVIRDVLVYWAIGFGILFAISWLLNRYTLSNVSSALQNAELKSSLFEALLGLLYRLVIFLLVIFFYASFAIMAAWVLVGGIHLLVTFSAGLIVFLIIAFFVFGAFYRYGKTFYYGLFASPPVAEGRRLRRDQAPELWSLILEVARDLDTKPIDFIYIAPASQMSVWESGSIFSVIFGFGQRNLLVGIDSLNVLTIQQFKAILAHEYSHFTNRDTSFGGFLSLRVYYAMQRTRNWLISQQQNQNWNIIWLFLKFFQPMFIRVTLGASQMQEVIADRNAARTYGSQAISDGLMNLINQAIRFDSIAHTEINAALKENRPIANLYEMEATEEIEENVKKTVGQIIFMPSGTHPPTVVRMAFFKKFGEKNFYNQPIDESLANRLIPNMAELEEEMMKIIEQDVTHRLLLMQYIHQARQQGKLRGRAY